MKKMLTIKKLGATVAFGLLVAPAFSQAPANGLPFNENTKEAWIQAHPAEYAKMNGQSTEKQSAAPMTAAEKEAWVKAHPAEYAKLVNEPVQADLAAEKAAAAAQPVQVKQLSLSEFNAFPAERQNFIRTNAHLFQVVDGKGNVISNF